MEAKLKLVVFSIAFLTLFFVGTFLAFVALPSSIAIDGVTNVNDFDVHGATMSSTGYRVSINVGNHTRVHPAVKALESRHKGTGALSAKFLSLYPGKLEFFYEDGKGGILQGHLELGQETTTNTYIGHVFFFTIFGNKAHEIARFRMKPSQYTYFIEDPDNPAPAHLVHNSLAEKEFSSEYLQRTGHHWRHFFGEHNGKLGPRPPPSLYMWPAVVVGQVHSIQSSEGHWLCQGVQSQCKSEEPVHMDIEVISVAPRAFVISNFLNEFEVEEIKRHASPRMAVSSVGDVDAGAFESDTRTSRNAWVKRSDSAVTETLFRRAAHLLQVDQELLHRRTNAEDLQVVHYKDGQKYDPHHDWGVSGYIESRYITLLLYLNDMASPHAGGETSFPKANDGHGIKVHPGKGNAVLFYNLLEDGNGDDLSLHAALPVHEGEKWLANFWVWDPRFH